MGTAIKTNCNMTNLCPSLALHASINYYSSDSYQVNIRFNQFLKQDLIVTDALCNPTHTSVQ